MSTTENKALVQRYMDNFNRIVETHDLSLLDDLMAPDVTLKLAGFPPEMQGREAYKQGLMMFISGFPDMRLTETSPMLAEGETIVVRVKWTGTHRGELMGIPATGKQVTVADIHIGRIRDGKIVEYGGIPDMMGILQQIGAVPAPQ